MEIFAQGVQHGTITGFAFDLPLYTVTMGSFKEHTKASGVPQRPNPSQTASMSSEPCPCQNPFAASACYVGCDAHDQYLCARVRVRVRVRVDPVFDLLRHCDREHDYGRAQYGSARETLGCDHDHDYGRARTHDRLFVRVQMYQARRMNTYHVRALHPSPFPGI